jgi:ABC-2 type transport system ATP-binding protein
VATRVVALEHGRVVADGSVAEVTRRAGGVRVRYRSDRLPPVRGARLDDGWITIHTDDAGLVVRELVDAGIELVALEVRPVTLDEALACQGET